MKRHTKAKIVKQIFLVFCSLLVLTALTILVLSLIPEKTNILEKPFVSEKKAFSIKWKEDSRHVFYLSEENPTTMGIRRITISPQEKEEEISLSFNPEQVKWMCNKSALLVNPNLSQKEGHFTKLDFETLEAEPFYLPFAFRNFYFSPDCEEVLVKSEEGKLIKYSMTEKKIIEVIQLPEKFENPFLASWPEKNEVIIATGDPNLIEDQNYFYFNLQSKEEVELNNKDKYLTNPVSHDKKALFASYGKIVLWNVEENKIKDIVETDSNPNYGASYSWVNKDSFIYLENVEGGTKKLILVNIKTNQKKVLFESEKGEYFSKPNIHVSPDKEKIAFKRPDGFLQIMRINEKN